MGFFKKIGKAISKGVGGVVKQATKMISVGTVRNALSGDFSAIAKEATGRLKTVVKDTGNDIVSSVIPHRTGGAKSPHPIAENMDIKNVADVMPSVANKLPIKEVALAALGGALSAAGNNILQNDKEVAAVSGKSAMSVAWATIQKYWYWFLGIPVLVFAAYRLMANRGTRSRKIRM